MNKIVCFGELLLRFSPDAEGNWINNQSMPVFIGGSELNVATALANWNMPVNYITSLPDNLLSNNIHQYLKQKGIDDSQIYHHGNRIGAYYMAQGSDLKHATVIYDRAHSSFAQLQPGMINWDEVLHEASWFHFSAITPALNENLVAVCKEALNAAKTKGIIISVDLNHRAKLWQWGKQPADVMPELVDYCSIIMGNLWSAESLLNIPVNANVHAEKNYFQHASQTAHHIMRRHKNCNLVAQTFRFDEEDGIQYLGTINTKENQFASKEFCSKKIKDKAGSGDCFMAGLLYGLQQKQTLQNIVDFAAAAAFGKLHETGDSTKQTATEVMNTINKFVCR